MILQGVLTEEQKKKYGLNDKAVSIDESVIERPESEKSSGLESLEDFLPDDDMGEER